ncbi:MAG: penicillin acylase family protein [Armatimonadetes bacterium]|nr:penicillin acylase family protein [Armatimonadota bacterium]
MTSLALAAVLVLHAPSSIERDTYGVPMVRAATASEAYELQGQACSQDRLWQLELSRRQASGTLAAVLGPSAERSDRETLARFYTEAELDAMFAALPKATRDAFEAYARGINNDIAARKVAGTLPAGYKENGFEPRPWTVRDSCAVVIRLARLFGTGGAGELRNLALLSYLKGQKVKGKELDVFDDLAWLDDPRSPTTVDPADNPSGPTPTIFGKPTRTQTAAQWAAEPKANLLELAGAVALAGQDESKLLASHIGTLYKTGSYAIVVSKKRSATGNPLLLTAPQMGHSTPSVVHEVAIDAPGLRVAGIDVPGIPGIAIGVTPQLAWGLTSGVADIEDIFWAPLSGEDNYLYDGKVTRLERVTFQLKVKGRPDATVTQTRTHHGPVVLLSRSGKAVFSLQSALWKNELATATTLVGINTASSPTDIDKAVADVSTTFNLFFATRDGHTGYRYVGHVPTRNPSLDPRLPTEDTPANQWRPVVPRAQMPHVDDPRSGLLSNWNNKSATWWPNGDTPVWGRIFRVDLLRASLTKPLLTPFDLEKAAWDIARKGDTGSFFQPQLVAALAKTRGREPASEAERQLAGWDGWSVKGSVGAEIYRECVRQLRRQLFLAPIGNLTSESLFTTALQPSLMADALDGKTKWPYLGTKGKDAVLSAAFKDAVDELTRRFGPIVANWQFAPGSINLPDEAPVPYINRGTYIQVTEMFPTGPSARSVASPGVSETGLHARDQVPLARAWTLKPMWNW